MSDSGSGYASGGTAEVQKKTNQVSLNIDPAALAQVITGKGNADPKDAHGDQTHAVQLSLDNTSFASFKTSVGDISLMKNANVTLDPGSKGPVVGAHLDVLNAQWADIGPVALSTIVSDDFKLTAGKPSDDIKFEQDATVYKNITLTGTITTTIDESGAHAQFEGGVKFTF